MQGAEHIDRFDGRQGQFGAHIVGNRGQAEHADLQFLSARLLRTQVVGAEVLQAEHEHLARHRLLEDIGMRGRLVANGRANEVAAVAVEALRYQQVDLTQVNKAQVERDLLGVGGLGLSPSRGSFLGYAGILSPSTWLFYG